MRKLAVVSLVLTLSLSAFAGTPVSQVKFQVLKDDNGKPVRNAAVVLHPVDGQGRQHAAGVELKTDADGVTSYPGVPDGKIRIQVLAHGFQTYGEDLDVNEANQTIVIKLKRPQQQYSIYQDHPGSEQQSEQPKK